MTKKQIEDLLTNTEFTRVEVIEPVGRVYTTHNKKVELSIQDEGRTLKIFIE